MLSRLFLILTILLVGITTVARGAPAAEIIEGIKAIKFSQMEFGNLALNRRFIKGVPGLPQCPDANHPDLVSSLCLDGKTITALCGDSNNPQNPASFITPCPNKTICMNFRTEPDPSVAPEYELFAMCVDKGSVKSFDNNRKDGFFCKTYKAEGVTNGIATVSVDIYDANSNPVKVRSISIDTGSQYASTTDANNYTITIDCKNGQKIRTCMDNIIDGIVLITMFAMLDGIF